MFIVETERRTQVHWDEHHHGKRAKWHVFYRRADGKGSRSQYAASWATFPAQAERDVAADLRRLYPRTRFVIVSIAPTCPQSIV